MKQESEKETGIRESDDADLRDADLKRVRGAALEGEDGPRAPTSFTVTNVQESGEETAGLRSAGS